MSEDILPGVNSANTRVHKVRAFLAKPPKKAAKLVMHASVSDGSPLQLSEWERDQLLPALAPEIVQLLEEHAEEMGGSVQCTLTYEDGEGKSLGTLPLRRQATHIENGAQLTAAMVAGDAQSLVVAAQAQSLQLQRLYMASMSGVLAASERLATREEDRVNLLQRQLAKLEVENEALRAALAQAEAFVAASDAGEPINAAQSQALELLKQLAPLLMQKLLSPGVAAPMPQA
jgi:hypothetical protein